MRIWLIIWLAALGLAPALAQTSGPPPRAHAVSLNYHQADLVFVLKKLAKALGKNIYISPEVQGSVTANFQNVPADRVMDVLLKMQDNRYDYKVLGNTLVVASPEKLQKIPENLFR